MKTALDPRHKKRQKIVEDLFKVEFHKQPIGKDTQEIMKHQKTQEHCCLWHIQSLHRWLFFVPQYPTGSRKNGEFVMF